MRSTSSPLHDRHREGSWGQRFFCNALVILALAVPVFDSRVLADVRIPFREVQENVAPHPEAVDRPGTCSIVYYNICSNHIETWAWTFGYVAGVVFDLPADCQKVPGESCTSVDFWWYWRYTYPGYGRTVTYNLHCVDSNLCLIDPPLGTLTGQDPTERWNHYEGLGTTDDDLVALTAAMDYGVVPFLVTDDTEANQHAGCAPIPSVIHSFFFHFFVSEPLCPPEPIQDQLGPVNILMDARFSCEPTGVESASWGSIKSLFR